MNTDDATRRLNSKKQTLDDAYAVPANFLEIDVGQRSNSSFGNTFIFVFRSSTRSRTAWRASAILTTSAV